MPNKNYLKGVRLERDIMKAFELKGFRCTRASGSHSTWDVIAYRVDQKPVFIQAKTTSRPSEAKRLIEEFKATIVPSKYYHQSLMVKSGRGMVSISEVTL